MKNLIILGFFILFLVVVQFAQAQTVDEVINKHIEALGGKANLDKIQNLVMEGTLDYQGNQVAMTFTRVHNKLNRQDISAGGMNGFNLVSDKDGWTYMPFFGMSAPEAKSAEEVKTSQVDMDIAGPLVNNADKGHKVELMGKQSVNGTDAFKIKITLADSKIMYVFLDPATYLITRKTQKRTVNGQETDDQIDYADYKLVEAVKMPHSLTDQYGTTYISGIKVNQKISDSSYKHDM